jgi:hypothetical protein
MPFIWDSVRGGGARNGKRALLIFSDGGDNSSRYSEKDIKRFVREADTQLRGPQGPTFLSVYARTRYYAPSL